MGLEAEFDAVVVGGSVAGLLAAREIAEAGFRVKVLEDDLEIGLPERCDGLVSMSCLEALGVAPVSNVVQNRIRRAVLHSPGGLTLEVDAGRQRVLVLDRSRFDRELARMACRSGAEIEVGQRVGRKVEGDDGSVRVETETASYRGRWVVNAAGYSALPRREGCVMPAAKFEVYGDWFDEETVEIFLDQKRTPGYFMWVIPVSRGLAKVGAAGWGVNQFKVLDEFVKSNGGVAVKKTAAQIVVGGPVERFVSGRVVSVGDAAGQAKPTTGGGIYSGGVGGVLAGGCIGECLSSGDASRVGGYEEGWRRLFGREFGLLLRARRVFERLDNDKIDRMFRVVASSDVMGRISSEDDFDFHSAALLKALGLKGVLQIAGIVAADLLSGLNLFSNGSKE